MSNTSHQCVNRHDRLLWDVPGVTVPWGLKSKPIINAPPPKKTPLWEINCIPSTYFWLKFWATVWWQWRMGPLEYKAVLEGGALIDGIGAIIKRTQRALSSPCYHKRIWSIREKESPLQSPNLHNLDQEFPNIQSLNECLQVESTHLWPMVFCCANLNWVRRACICLVCWRLVHKWCQPLDANSVGMKAEFSLLLS